ncbi:bifunctional protein HldE [Catellatospora sp. IY07-71]|uniref:PfkB family carbohydrate kinase n=1 Tax=Catellatospora sp. IY07-71 TaxID=2728827 RepID=UPI001BB647F5|nr:PfkB family carbohydrate kinase [Catellatospora sp. IY07-71]BCJ76363.1 bifunctional protein HldE [Catellatospora sp. IY07-71]
MTPQLLVVGDSLLDLDVAGSVDRISPDAPVPVFEEGDATARPGGAALAATLLALHGHRVRLLTAIGADEAGQRLRGLLDEHGVEVLPLPYRGHTPEKIRLLSGRQVVLRLDRSAVTEPVGEPAETALVALAQADGVLVADYGRGVTSANELRRVLATVAGSRPVVWDPHPRSRGPVHGMRLVTPNEHELPADDDGTAPHADRLGALTRRAATARLVWRAGAVALTLGAQGALLADGSPVPLVVAPPLVGEGDTCGAGDRFAGAATAALAEGALASEAVQVAVAAAARFVACGGAQHYRQDSPAAPAPGAFGLAAACEVVARTRAAGGRVVATGGCFDLLHAGHVATLRAARDLGDCLVVCVNSDRSVRGLKGAGRPLVGQDDRAQTLAALGCVDAVVVFDDATPLGVLEHLRPDVWVKGGDYNLQEPGAAQPSGGVLPEADRVRDWGGQCVLVPYVAGHSTTALIHSARRTAPAAPEEARRSTP